MTVVDTIAPVTTHDVGKPRVGTDPTFVTPRSKVNLKVEDAVSGKNYTEYKVDDGDWMEYSSSIMIEENGDHNITFRSVDRAGNVEDMQVLWVFVDGDAPVTILQADGLFTDGNVAYVKSSSSIELDVSDYGSGIDITKYCLDSGMYAEYNYPFKITEEGKHSLEYYSTDKLGQRESPNIIELWVDDTPPSTAHDAPLMGQNQDFTVELVPSDSGSGVNITMFRVKPPGGGSGDWGLWTEGTLVDFEVEEDHSKDGVYTIEFYSLDNVGNEEPHKLVDVIVDTIAEVTVNIQNGTVYDMKFLEVKGEVEPGSIVTINGREVVVGDNGHFSENITMTKGENAILIEVEDPVGNTATEDRTVVFKPPVTDVESYWWLWILIVVIIIAVVAVVVVRVKKKKRVEPETVAPPTAAPAETYPAAQPAAAQGYPEQPYAQTTGYGAYESPPPPPPVATPVATPVQPPDHGARPLPPPPPSDYYQEPSPGEADQYHEPGFSAEAQLEPAGLPPPPPPQVSRPLPPPPPVASAEPVSVDRDEAKQIIDAARLELEEYGEGGIRFTKAKNNIRIAESFFKKGKFQKSMMYAEKAMRIIRED
jgi:hypothetical protein